MRKSAIVVGGCGFIGINCVTRLLNEGHSVLCIDNLSRPTARANLEWLTRRVSPHPDRFSFAYSDIRHSEDLEEAFRGHLKSLGAIDLVIHEAAQVAVTTSLTAPRHDFEINVLGTFNVLEAVRTICPEATLIFASTNKVYGSLESLEVLAARTRYEFKDLPGGVPVSQPLDLHTPYGCSKGAGDQYVRDYARIFKLRTFVFRQSCIYGTRQFGQEDQGWVSWFVIATLLKNRVTIFGGGKQVRDLLWIDDLLDAYWQAWRSALHGGEVFNLGGGPQNTLSLLELLDILKELDPSMKPPKFAPQRPADQPVFIADITQTERKLNWKPTVSPRRGSSGFGLGRKTTNTY